MTDQAEKMAYGLLAMFNKEEIEELDSDDIKEGLNKAKEMLHNVRDASNSDEEMEKLKQTQTLIQNCINNGCNGLFFLTMNPDHSLYAVNFGDGYDMEKMFTIFLKNRPHFIEMFMKAIQPLIAVSMVEDLMKQAIVIKNGDEPDDDKKDKPKTNNMSMYQ